MMRSSCRIFYIARIVRQWENGGAIWKENSATELNLRKTALRVSYNINIHINISKNYHGKLMWMYIVFKKEVQKWVCQITETFKVCLEFNFSPFNLFCLEWSFYNVCWRKSCWHHWSCRGFCWWLRRFRSHKRVDENGIPSTTRQTTIDWPREFPNWDFRRKTTRISVKHCYPLGQSVTAVVQCVILHTQTHMHAHTITKPNPWLSKSQANTMMVLNWYQDFLQRNIAIWKPSPESAVCTEQRSCSLKVKIAVYSLCFGQFLVYNGVYGPNLKVLFVAQSILVLL